MSIDTSVQEVKVQKGMNIWGIFGCSQCGACCCDYHIATAHNTRIVWF